MKYMQKVSFCRRVLTEGLCCSMYNDHFTALPATSRAFVRHLHLEPSGLHVGLLEFSSTEMLWWDFKTTVNKPQWAVKDSQNSSITM